MDYAQPPTDYIQIGIGIFMMLLPIAYMWYKLEAFEEELDDENDFRKPTREMFIILVGIIIGGVFIIYQGIG